MNTLDARLTPDCLHLNDSAIVTAGPVATFHEILGSPSRVVGVGPPAPVGHRNNQIHIYDSLGVCLNEHHYTYQARPQSRVTCHVVQTVVAR